MTSSAATGTGAPGERGTRSSAPLGGLRTVMGWHSSSLVMRAHRGPACRALLESSADRPAFRPPCLTSPTYTRSSLASYEDVMSHFYAMKHPQK
jgi:hypothetical protein